jgi:hypothetical protein
MGSLRALNLLTGGIVLATSVPAVLLHAAIAYFVYIVAVTLLGVLEDEPRVKPKTVVSLGLLAPVCAGLALTQTAAPAMPTAFAALLLVVLWLRALRRRSFDQRAIRRVMLFLLLGTMLYTSLLCLGSQRCPEALAILGAALLGRKISRKIAVT